MDPRKVRGSGIPIDAGEHAAGNAALDVPEKQASVDWSNSAPVCEPGKANVRKELIHAKTGACTANAHGGYADYEEESSV